MRKLMLVAGARPNFMKIAPLLREMRKHYAAEIQPVLVHTGQHYDHLMSQSFFDELGIAPPDHHLGVGSGSHAQQTARVMTALEEVMLAERPDCLVVVGDVNSTLAGALVAAKLLVPVAHVEAGLRSFDRGMPEEINRLVTDALADTLFVTEPSGRENLLREGRPPEAIHLVGNVMVDTLLHELKRPLPRLEPAPAKPYAVLTLHRPANVDRPEKLGELMAALEEVARELPVYFPAHPRTQKALAAAGLAPGGDSGITVMDPLPYRSFLALWKDAALVITDSGGLQEETTALGVPCFTLRDNTERPITVEVGTNTLVGSSGQALVAAFRRFQEEGPKKGRVPELWDGRAAERIVRVLAGG